LREAIRRGGEKSTKLLKGMEAKARSYMDTLEPDEDEPPHVRRERLRAGPVARRPAAAEAAVRHTGSTGMLKRKVEPLPGSDSTPIRPPWRSTIFLQVARPMPVPGRPAAG
jgi:hypothetical protein